MTAVFERLKIFFANRKNMYIVLGSVFLVAVLLLGLILSTSPPAAFSFTEITNVDASRTEKLDLQDGSSRESVSVEEPEDIESFYALISPLTFQEMRRVEAEPAWQFTVDVFQPEGHFVRVEFTDELASFTTYDQSEGQANVAGEQEYYQVIAPETDVDILASLGSFYDEMLLAMMEREAGEGKEEEEILEITVKEINPAIAVVINNHPASRPSSGLQQADLVYEFLVEGGSTRYLAVFRTLQEANFNIGPIRSLRPYFAVQALEHGGIVAHSGYSTRTRQMIQGLGIFQIGDTGSNFWRDSSRRAPHNLYTNINNLYRAAGDRPQVMEKTYVLDEEQPAAIFGKADVIEIDYSPHNRVHYTYDPEERWYYRFINGEPHTELETGEQYTAARVIIRHTPHRNVPGSEGLVDIELHGSGTGILYENGYEYQVTWERTGDQTVYQYIRGGEVEPIHETTWIQVVRK